MRSIALLAALILVPAMPGSAQGCPDLAEILEELPGFLAERMAEELHACAPEQLLGDDAWCSSYPPDGHPCAAQGGGCSLRLRVLDVQADAVTVATEVTGRRSDGCELSGAFTSTYTIDHAWEQESGSVQLVPAVDYPPDPVDVLDCAGLVIPATIGTELRHTAWLRVDEAVQQLASAYAVRCAPDVATPTLDSDGDGTPDCLDACPADPLKTSPGCGCGLVDDSDGDGYAFCGEDCDDVRDFIWATPGPVDGLRIRKFNATLIQLEWDAVEAPGGTSFSYRMVRSDDPGSLPAPYCASIGSTIGYDGTALAPGETFFYLVQATNSCPDGDGPLGEDSAGNPRTAAACFQ